MARNEAKRGNRLKRGRRRKRTKSRKSIFSSRVDHRVSNAELRAGAAGGCGMEPTSRELQVEETTTSFDEIDAVHCPPLPAIPSKYASAELKLWAL